MFYRGISRSIMQVIKRLPSQLANQIAAGEVVQRPASVVKELLENAIDAGATEITLSVRDGGRTLISIQDNGSGMNAADALLCFERHATSKIDVIDDLFKLTTMGFRGEALASIGAIAHVDLKTKPADKVTGFHVRIEGGIFVSQDEVVCQNGTLIEVKNLFFNVPARRNFLKSDSIEFNHIEDAFLHVSISHPEIGFILHHNNQAIYNLNGTNLKRRITDVLGKNSGDKVFPIECNTDIVKLTGFIGKPFTARKTRGEQYFFVNRRFFRSSYFNHAVNKAFEGLIPDKTHPVYFVFLELDPSKIDVNIHPTKTEIKFEEERYIYSILHSTIRQGLGMFNLAPSLDFELETAFDLPAGFRKNPIVEPSIQIDPTFNPFHKGDNGGSGKGFTSAIKEQGFGTHPPSEKEWQAFYKINEESDERQEVLIAPESFLGNAEYIVTGNFILSPLKNGIMVVDFRRAMERILYDESIDLFIKQPLHQQMLLFPIEKKLEKQELRLLNQHLRTFEQLGFKLEIEEEKVAIHGAPELIPENGVLVNFESLLEKMAFCDQSKEDLAHALVTAMTKGAAMYLRTPNKDEVESIIFRLFACKEHTISPSNEVILRKFNQEQLQQLIQ